MRARHSHGRRVAAALLSLLLLHGGPSGLPRCLALPAVRASGAPTQAEPSRAPALGGAQRVAPEQLPLRVRGRYITDAQGARVKLACANWAGHMEALIPEGLSHRPLAAIASQVCKTPLTEQPVHPLTIPR